MVFVGYFKVDRASVAAPFGFGDARVKVSRERLHLLCGHVHEVSLNVEAIWRLPLADVQADASKSLGIAEKEHLASVG